jgi:hypothetical protein
MASWASSIRNIFRKRELRKLSEAIRESLIEANPRIVDGFLTLLLNVMSLMLWVNKDYHRNIKGFRAKYMFKSKGGELRVSAIFKRTPIFRYNYLEVGDKELTDANVTITFKDTRALMRLLLSPKPDILGALLANEVEASGNVNYILKFGFMTTQLQQMILSGIQVT